MREKKNRTFSLEGKQLIHIFTVGNHKSVLSGNMGWRLRHWVWRRAIWFWSQALLLAWWSWINCLKSLSLLFFKFTLFICKILYICLYIVITFAPSSHSFWLLSFPNSSTLYFHGAFFFFFDLLSLVRAACMSTGERLFTGAWQLLRGLTAEENDFSPRPRLCPSLKRK